MKSYPQLPAHPSCWLQRSPAAPVARPRPSATESTGRRLPRELPGWKTKRSVADLRNLLLGMHLVGLRKLHRIPGQTNHDIADFFVAHGVVERNRIDDLMIRLERFLERPSVLDSVDHERAGSIAQMAERLDHHFLCLLRHRTHDGVFLNL